MAQKELQRQRSEDNRAKQAPMKRKNSPVSGTRLITGVRMKVGVCVRGPSIPLQTSLMKINAVFVEDILKKM